MSVSVVVAGGHSAGHIEPAMATADAVMRLRPDALVAALGTVRGLDTTLIPARGYPLELIPPVPLPRRITPDLFKAPGRVGGAVKATAEVLRRVQADVVVGFGGYIAFPAYIAARRLGIPFVIHEANARAGVANKVGAYLTPHVYTAGPGVHLRHGQAIGIPLRPAISQLDRAAEQTQARLDFGLRPDLPTLVVTGGSQGARAINAAVAQARAGLSAAGVQVLHIVGPLNELDESDTGEVPYIPVQFVDGMQKAYAAADFMLCRSGAMTVAELTAVGLPAAYVPFPLRGGEQRLNAVGVVAAGGGILVENEDLNGQWILDQVVPRITNSQTLAQMTAAAAGSGERHADEILAKAVLALVG
jgi:UDP-N-acetylglucosamine--N-acetylmuramyl-(pentapeptide) pyrophosphoryl-undecaprenol N-acetylglucosamine transferase